MVSARYQVTVMLEKRGICNAGGTKTGIRQALESFDNSNQTEKSRANCRDVLPSSIHRACHPPRFPSLPLNTTKLRRKERESDKTQEIIKDHPAVAAKSQCHYSGSQWMTGPIVIIAPKECSTPHLVVARCTNIYIHI